MTTWRNRPHRIGVMGGTFDPIHHGHLFAANEAAEFLGLDRVVFIPSGTPPHKRYNGMATAEERYEMTLLATSSNPRFEISRIETMRAGKSYTSDTLRAFRESETRRASEGSESTKSLNNLEIFFIVGADAAMEIMDWHRPLEIVEIAKIAVVARPGYARDRIDALPEEIRSAIVFIDTVTPDISGTDIRERAGRGKSIAYLTPDPVCEYIKKNNLYHLYDLSGGESF